MDLDRFITITEAAPLLGVSRSTAYRLAKAGQFPVPVKTIGSKQVVSLRRVQEHIGSEAA